ncbi:MAG: hypothetical protein ACTHME_05195 [Candidatus Nitrosocosmicus sp.]
MDSYPDMIVLLSYQMERKGYMKDSKVIFKDLKIKKGTIHSIWDWAVVDVKSSKRSVFVKDFRTQEECEKYISESTVK